MRKLLLLLLFIPFVSFSQDELELAKLYPLGKITIKYHTDWTKIHYQERLTNFKKNPLKFGEIIFIGNSITEGGKNWSEKFNLPNIRNRGIGGDVTDGVLERLEEIIYFKPKAIFLLIGINDLFNLHYQKQIPSAKYVGNNIFKITKQIKKKSPSTQIYVQTLLPTDKDFMKPNIDEVNNIIKNYSSLDTYQVIDLNKVFSNRDGFLRKELTSDGTHLNELGYEIWVKTEFDIISNLLKMNPNSL